MSTANTKAAEAIALLGGVTAVAKMFELTPWAVSKWQRSQVPAERCIELEKATRGRVRCEELRPDIDWPYLRGSA